MGHETRLFTSTADFSSGTPWRTTVTQRDHETETRVKPDDRACTGRTIKGAIVARHLSGPGTCAQTENWNSTAYLLQLICAAAFIWY